MVTRPGCGRSTSTAPATARSPPWGRSWRRSEEHTSELQSQSNLLWRLLLEKKNEQSVNVRALSAARIQRPVGLYTVPAPVVNLEVQTCQSDIVERHVEALVDRKYP